MYCSTCGKEINDNAEICVQCGCRVKMPPTANANVSVDDYTSKTAVGVFLCLFLGLIGLIIGLLLYKNGTVARETFLHGWLTTFWVTVIIGILVAIFFFAYIYDTFYHYNY